jgi:hypothetical protein
MFLPKSLLGGAGPYARGWGGQGKPKRLLPLYWLDGALRPSSVDLTQKDLIFLQTMASPLSLGGPE